MRPLVGVELDLQVLLGKVLHILVSLQSFKVALVSLFDELDSRWCGIGAVRGDDVLLVLLIEGSLACALSAVVEADEHLPSTGELLDDLTQRVNRLD